MKAKNEGGQMFLADDDENVSTQQSRVSVQSVNISVPVDRKVIIDDRSVHRLVDFLLEIVEIDERARLFLKAIDVGHDLGPTDGFSLEGGRHRGSDRFLFLQAKFREISFAQGADLKEKGRHGDRRIYRRNRDIQRAGKHPSLPSSSFPPTMLIGQFIMHIFVLKLM